MTAIASVANIPSALQSATSAIQRSVRAVSVDAGVVANAQGFDSRDMLEALIDSRQQVLYTKAAAKLIDASNEMMSTMLDITA